MRRKKLPPPRPPEQPNDEPKFDQGRASHILEQVLEQGLSDDFAATPQQICDFAEMFLSLLHIKKVEPQYWVEHSKLALHLIGLCVKVDAEASLIQVEGLPKDAKKTLMEAVNLSVGEIKGVRGKLYTALGAVKQIPPPGTTIH